MKKVIGWNLSQVRMQELKEMVDAQEGITDADCTGILVEKAEEAVKKGILIHTKREDRVKNDIFSNEESGLHLVIIDSCYRTLIDTRLKILNEDRCICSRYTKKKDEPNWKRKPSIRLNGKVKSIYRLLFPNSSEVDHKTRNRGINLSALTRGCTAAENSKNKKYRSSIKRLESGRRFTTRCQLDDINSISFSEEEKMGYKIDRVQENSRIDVKSPLFSNEDEMYHQINCIEKKLFGDLRYDPLLDCETVSDELLFYDWLFFGTLTAKEYKYAKLYALKKRPDPKGCDICKYYGL